MAIDANGLAKACGAKKGELDIANHLCRTQIEEFQRRAKGADTLLVACTQEAPLFLETLDEMGQEAGSGVTDQLGADQKTATGTQQITPDIRFTNIREKAGWSKDATDKKPAQKTNITAKMAALLAEAALDIEDATSVSMESAGVAVILGRDSTVLEAAETLSARLDVTVILEPGSDVPPPRLMQVPVFQGHVTGAEGHLGEFKVSVEDFSAAAASSKQSLTYDANIQKGISEADLILDLRGGTALFTAPEKRDGYYNPDPGNPALIAKALLELTDMVGTFEKPRYVDYDAATCAYSRATITGCTRCLDSCPTGAITPDGDKVDFNPYVCAGCGTCASVCPTGAARYALPAGDTLFQRLRTLVRTYLKAGGTSPSLLVHDTGFGDDIIDVMARAGGGLPANVLPFAVNQVTQVGLDFLFAAAGWGAERVLILLAPQKADEKALLDTELALAETVLDGLGYGSGETGGRFEIVEDTDPGALEKRLYGLNALPGMPDADFLPMGRKRSIMSLALAELHKAAPTPVDAIELPAGAPFGAVNVDIAECTVCLACAGACPTGALRDNEDKPQLSFTEEACVQCGLCRNTCPENVITLTPQLSFLSSARQPQVIKEEDPFECIRCGKAFGAKSSVEAMVEKLQDHPMFQDKGGTDRLKMCDDCRVFALAEEDEHPMASAARPVPRTTDDYLREREELRQSAARDMKEKGLATTDDSDNDNEPGEKDG